MATTIPLRPRPARLQRVLITLTGIAAVLAVLPIIAAVAFGAAEPSGSAFAQAPSGNYAVVSRTVQVGAENDEFDIISVVNGETGATIDVASVPHLAGFSTSGAVSPSGNQLALIVPDSGTQARPAASLVLVDLDSGATNLLAQGLDAMQTPAWAPSGQGVAVTRTAAADSGEDLPAITAVFVSTGGEATDVLTTNSALGVYAVGFDADERLVTVHIDGDGSRIFRDSEPGPQISEYITRDWSLSPDRTQLAYIETNQSNGVAYLPRVTALAGAGVSAQAFSSDDAEALGSAWAPGDEGGATFGTEPGAASASAQSLTSGFDIPLAYSKDGDALAVKHWSGSSFDAPGSPTIELVTDSGREPLPGTVRFFGWATR